MSNVTTTIVLEGQDRASAAINKAKAAVDGTAGSLKNAAGASTKFGGAMSASAGALSASAGPLGDLARSATAFGAAANLLPGPLGLAVAGILGAATAAYTLHQKAQEAGERLRQAFGADRVAEAKALAAALNTSTDGVIAMRDAVAGMDAELRPTPELLRLVRDAAVKAGEDGEKAMLDFAKATAAGTASVGALMGVFGGPGAKKASQIALEQAGLAKEARKGLKEFSADADAAAANADAALGALGKLTSAKAMEIRELSEGGKKDRLLAEALAKSGSPAIKAAEKEFDRLKAIRDDRIEDLVRFRAQEVQIEDAASAAQVKAAASSAAAVVDAHTAATRKASAKKGGKAASGKSDAILAAEWEVSENIRLMGVNAAAFEAEADAGDVARQQLLDRKRAQRDALIKFDDDEIARALEFAAQKKVIDDKSAADAIAAAQEEMAVKMALAQAASQVASAVNDEYSKRAIAQLEADKQRALQGAATDEERAAIAEQFEQQKAKAVEDAERRKAAILGLMEVANAAASFPNIPAMIAHGVAAGLYGAVALGAVGGADATPAGGAAGIQPSSGGGGSGGGGSSGGNGGNVTNIHFNRGFVTGTPQDVGKYVQGALGSLKNTGMSGAGV